MKEVSKANTPLYVRTLGRFTSYFPDFDFSFIKPVRKKAVELLNLKPGDRVVDAGCGSGGSFPFLVDAVGPTGSVVGIEISPASKKAAEKRIAKNGWRNVGIIEAPAQTAYLQGKFDGVLMFAAADVYASEEALKKIAPHLKENARVVFFGAKLSRQPAGFILNPIFRMLFKLSFSTTPPLNFEPWQVAASFVEEMEISEYFFGSMFLAWGSLAPKK